MILLTIIVFILVLGALILVHEFSHFIFAKRTGMRVEEFGLGYPPRVIGFFKENNRWRFFWGSKEPKTKSTVYSLNLIPFGGFNKIYGMESREKKPVSFWSKSIGKRAMVISAGVLGNFLLTVILLSIGYCLGLPQIVEGKVPVEAKEVGIQIILVNRNSPAESAGIKIGDKILKIKTQDSEVKVVKEVKDVQDLIKKNLGQPIIITLKRGNKILEKEVIPRKNPPKGQGPIGIALAKTARIPYPWYESILKGFENTFLLTGATFEAFFQLLKAAIIKEVPSGVELTGPIGIGSLIFQMIDLGWIYVLQFTAILSLNLAILNILPFPALDGGRLIFLLIEKIRKKPVKIEIENLVNQIGFVLLIILMIAVTFKDIQRLWG